MIDPPNEISELKIDMDAPDSKLSTSSSSHHRDKTIKTFIVSVPIGIKSPKIKHGHIRKLNRQDTTIEIEKHIDEVENIVQNIQVLQIECSNCVGSFKNIFNNCKVKSKVSAI
jgi:hypothetical protein